MTNLITFSAQYLYLFEMVMAAFYFFLQPRSKQKSIIVLSVAFLPLAYVVAQVIAAFYFDPRPFVVDHFTPLISHAPDNGFPSDHMLLASAVASILFVYNKRLGAIAWIMALIIGASRVFVGIHHWVDIIGSAAITVGTMWFTKNYLMPRLMKSNFLSTLLKKDYTE